MRAIVVYESMFGNTHEVAERIGDGLRATFDVTVMSVGEAIGQFVLDADLLVVGGPTHVHGMSRPSTRAAADEQARDDETLTFELGADGPGLREWFDAMPRIDGHAAAAFDTRVDAPVVVTGRASKAIGKRLRHHGFRLVAEPESFLVDRDNHLLDGEADRASTWGAELAAARQPAT